MNLDRFCSVMRTDECSTIAFLVCVVTQYMINFVLLVTLLIASVQDGRPASIVAAGDVAYAGRYANDLIQPREAGEQDETTRAIADELEGVHDRVKMSTPISRMGKGIVQDHFLVGVAEYTRYDQLRKDLVDYLSAKKHLGGDSSGVHGRSRDQGGLAPMEIGTVKGQQGKRQHQQPQRSRCQRSTSSTDVRTLWTICTCE